VGAGVDAADARRALVRLDDVADRLPELLFVLMTPREQGRPGGVEVRQTTRQEWAVVAYSSVDKLVSACGSGQPWAQVMRDRLEEICAELDIGVVVFDAVVDVAPRYQAIDSREQPPLEPLEPLDEHDGYLYVPSRPVREGQYTVELELQPDRTGYPVMLAYTSPELLAACCGDFQPWVSIHVDDLPGVIEESGAQGVLFNPVLAEESRHAGPVHDWTHVRQPEGIDR
jgi:mRNA-degrading endonuclease toxin of MazEF toxin-antitoxin module